MTPTVKPILMPHGVWYATCPAIRGNNAGDAVLAVRVDPLEAMHAAYRMLVSIARTRKESQYRPLREWADRPMYRVRSDSRWNYLWEDDAFFHWKPSDHSNPRKW